jgi:protease secretion system membrane fusion protein
VLEVVPTNQPLMVEAQLPVHLIDKVYEGLEVEMMFTAFNQNRTPHIPGVVMVVGDDRIVDERTGQPYFKIMAEATPEGKKLLGDHKVRPGMPVDVFVKTGERTMMSYLLKPLLDRMHSALREE